MDRKKRAQGFSLLEVVVSLVVLTILATGLLGSLVYVRRGMESGNQRLMAANLLYKKITEFRIRGAKNLPAAEVPQVATAGELHNGLFEWTIVRPETDNENWKEVRISAGWDSEVKPAQTHTGVQDCEFSKTLQVFLSQG